MTDSDDTEMFDHEDEDKDLESQVRKGSTPPEVTETQLRKEREQTPAPQTQTHNEKSKTPEPVEGENPFDTPSSTTSEKSESTETAAPAVKVVPESALPTKLVSPKKS